MKLHIIAATVPILALSIAGAFGQTEGRAVIRTVGQLERDGTATYSVFAASKNDDLGELMIAVAIPPGARFLEALHRPQGAVFEGVQKDVAYWSLPTLDRDTVIGPIVFRVKPDGSGADLPASAYAAIAYQRPVSELVQGPPAEGKLTPQVDRGSIVIDERGTVDATGANVPVFIGDTGAALFVPEGAVDRRVTITATRLPIDDSKLPQTDPPTWWCTLFQFTAEPQVTFSKQIKVSLPTRRPITPGFSIKGVATSDPNDWSKTPARGAAPSNQIGFGLGSFGGTCVGGFGGFQNIGCSFGGGFGFGGFGAFGYVEQDNIVSRNNGGNVSAALGVPSAAAAVISPPSIIAILIGLR